MHVTIIFSLVNQINFQGGIPINIIKGVLENPVITLILGYLLSFSQEFIRKKIDKDKMRYEKKVKAYEEIFSALLFLFEEHKTFFYSYDRFSDSQKNNERHIKVCKKHDDLKRVINKKSIYIEKEILSDLLEFIGRYNKELVDDFQLLFYDNNSENEEDNVFSKEVEKNGFILDQQMRELENNWEEAKKIMNDMRKELGLEDYPDELEIFSF